VQGACPGYGPNNPDLYDWLTRAADLQQQLPARSQSSEPIGLIGRSVQGEWTVSSRPPFITGGLTVNAGPARLRSAARTCSRLFRLILLKMSWIFAFRSSAALR
jgi:hypothetical protein